MPASESQKRASKVYLEKMETVEVRMPKGKRAIVAAYAKSHGESVNHMINRLIDEEMQQNP